MCVCRPFVFLAQGQSVTRRGSRPPTYADRMTGALLLLLAALAIPAISIGTMIRRGREIRMLAERGRVGRGRIVGRVRHAYRGRPGGIRRIELAHDAGGSGDSRRRITVTARQWETLDVGASVDVVYLPDRPEVFATLDLVNRARRAKGLPPLEPS